MVTLYPEHVSLEEANDILKKVFSVTQYNIKDVPIADSLGCTLACDIKAKRNVPHYAASAVDGYALDALATAGASSASLARIAAGSYLWVNTGSDLPVSANAVLMVEDSSFDGDCLLAAKSLTPSSNIRPIGEDVMAGQIIAYEGDVVSPALISLLLCAGFEKVSVVKKPKTLFIPTGDEIISQEKWLSNSAPKSGTVAESNSLYIASLFEQWGYDVDISEIVPDDANSLYTKIQENIADYEVIMVGAGSAKGKRDHTAEVLEKLGRIIFRWIRMKPGRPAIAAEVSGKPVICVPGFPMSTAVVLWSIVYPLLQIISKKKPESYISLIKDALGCRKEITAKLLVPHSSSAGIEEWLRVKTALVGNTLYAWALTSGASVLLALTEADGIVLLPKSALECEKDSDVNIFLLKESDLSKRILFQGSDDPAIQRLVTPIRKRGCDLAVRAVGSMGGLAALARGECHLAAAHLLDEADGSYNDSFIKSLSKGQKWKRVLVFYRMQGIITARGNPKNIKNFSDICKEGIVFANRQPGAGTRVLFDYFLKQHGTPASSIEGYSVQCTTHMEAANRVATGLADATLGIKSAADALCLDFVPLAEEPYELVIDEKYLDNPGVLALLDSLNDPLWRREVMDMGGYRWPN